MLSGISRGKLRPWIGNALAVCLGLLAVLILLTAAEGVLRLKLRLTTAPESVPVVGNLDGAISHASILGVEGTPNGVIYCRASRGGRTLYDTACATDAAGRRLTPCDADMEGSRLALFFGCSMTFGLGVKDDETLPARYCAHAPNCCSLNYAMVGYGPQQMWLQICKQHVLKEFGARKGIIVYTFIDDHVNRLAGTPNIVSEWPYALPWIELQDGHAEYRGTLFDRSPLQYLYLHHIHRMHLARFVENHIPRHRETAHPSGNTVELLAELIRECAETAAHETPDLKFYCLIFPRYATSEWGRPLAQRLAGSGVGILDYSDLFEKQPHTMDELFFDDNTVCKWGHPKALGYEIMAQQMNRDIIP